MSLRTRSRWLGSFKMGIEEGNIALPSNLFLAFFANSISMNTVTKVFGFISHFRFSSQEHPLFCQKHLGARQLLGC